MDALDSVQLNFSPVAVLVLNGLLAIIVFGIALDLTVADFLRVRQRWRALATGLIAQWLLLPLVTLALVMLLEPSASLALGMVLIAVCPGGAVSNFFSHLARGDVALSVSLSAFSSLACFALMPLGIAFWGSLLPLTRGLLASIHIDFVQMLALVAAVLITPTVLGMLLSHHRPPLAATLRKPFRWFGMGSFALFVVLAFIANGRLFMAHGSEIIGIVFIHNALALLLGVTFATLTGCTARERRAIGIEVGIQNTALGLTVAFTFFPALGSMALITAWWGVWHLISGAAVSLFWSRRQLSSVSPSFVNR